MRPGLDSECESDAATVESVVRFRDHLLEDGHDPKSIGVAMTSIGAGILCGVRETTVYPVPEGAKPPSGI
jgi:hypothetical protein